MEREDSNLQSRRYLAAVVLDLDDHYGARPKKSFRLCLQPLPISGVQKFVRFLDGRRVESRAAQLGGLARSVRAVNVNGLAPGQHFLSAYEGTMAGGAFQDGGAH